MTRSLSSATRPKMYAYIGFVMCCLVGGSVAYYPERQAPYNPAQYDPYSEVISTNYIQEPSQRLFLGTQGSNQVADSRLWETFSNNFRNLGNMFGRIELPSQYGVPNQYDVPSIQYGVPGFNQAQYYPQQNLQYYQQEQQVLRQLPSQQVEQRFVKSGRDVGVTDDAIIVTPPFVPPIAAQEPVPAPVPAPVPSPVPAQEPAQGYAYNKPQYRLELPH